MGFRERFAQELRVKELLATRRVKSERVESEDAVAATPRLYIVNVTVGIIHRRERFRFALNERYTLL